MFRTLAQVRPNRMKVMCRRRISNHIVDPSKRNRILVINLHGIMAIFRKMNMLSTFCFILSFYASCGIPIRSRSLQRSATIGGSVWL